MNYFFLFLISLVLVIFQTSFLSHFPIFGWLYFLPGYISGWTLNIVLIFAFWLLVFRDFKKSLFFAFSAGIFLDFISVETFGISLFSLIFSIFVINLLFVLSKVSNVVRFFAFLPIIIIFYEVLYKFLLWGVLAIIK